MAEALNPDGSLRAGAEGSFDARQFTMRMAPDGRPVFRPASVAGAGDEYWQNSFALAGTNGTVYAVTRAGSDVYIGGAFSTVGNTVARNVAKWDGTRWSSLGTGANNGVKGGLVKAIAVIGSEVYLGADAYFVLGNGGGGSVVKWNGSAWSVVGNTQGPNGPVHALAVVGTVLYAGGSFGSADGVAASGIARWDGSTWRSLGTGLGFNSQNGSVYSLAVLNGNLYVGGFFNRAGFTPANYVAKWDGSTWSSLGTGADNGLSGGASNLVTAIAVRGTDVYVAGGFTQAGSVASSHVARWNGSTWSSLGTGIAGSNIPRALVVAGTDVYVGGNFTEAGGVLASGIARWNGSTWTGVGTGTGNARGAEGSGEVHALAMVGSDVYAAGKFAFAGGGRADGVARWDGTAWNNLGPAAAQANGVSGFLYAETSIYAVAVNGSDVYIGGAFAQVGGVAASNIAQWNGTSWTALGAGSNEGVTGTVLAISVSGTNVYVGGSFTKAGTTLVSNVAKWDGNAWSSLGSGLAAQAANSVVNTLVVAGTDVYAGGRFTQAGATPLSNVAKWNGSTWSSLGAGVTGGTSSQPTAVYALALAGGTLYVGGAFAQAGTVAASNLATWDGSNWGSPGGGVSGGNQVVFALAAAGTDVYAGGRFTQAGTVAANNLARWNGSAWSSLGAGNANGVNGTVNKLLVAGGEVYVAGSFAQAGTAGASNLVKWDGSRWNSLGSGTNGPVHGLATNGAGLYVVGRFVAAGDEDKVMNGIGLYNPAIPTASTSARPAMTLSLYPNPAQASVTLQLAPATTARPVLVYDGQGRLLRQSVLPAGAGTAVVPLHGLAAGTYLIRCGTAAQRLVLP